MPVKAPKVNSREHEQTILGMALADVDTAKAVANIPGELFYYSRHRGIHYGIKKLVEKKAVVDMMALVAELGDEYLMAIADCGNKGTNPALLKQRVNELRDIRFKHAIQNLPDDMTPEELEDLIKKYKPDAEEDRSYVPDKAETLKKIKEYAKEGGAKQWNTGWTSVDEYYRVVLGQLTVLTGIPGSGKSTWLDNLIVNLVKAYGWNICVFSPESMPIEQHYGRLIEIYSGSTMEKRTTSIPKITNDQIEKAFDFIYDKIKILYIPPEERSLDGIMSQVTGDYQGFVLDPWNEIEHNRDPNMSETEYIGNTLMRLKAYAIYRKQHIWMVAHPTKLQKENGQYKPPMPYDISGSAHWYNKPDMCVTVHKKKQGDSNYVNQIIVNKVRVRGTGKIGDTVLNFDWQTQRFSEEVEF
jgi:hypothetical protein